ncbi:MAG: hypothetical protein PHC64_02520 [Candidatus Gastranaerophilales bacterium]|nr:hypothetical protein [Candidatus Gastranaerophilales bacterium]
MVNPINVNTQGIGNGYGFGPKPKQEEKETKEMEQILSGENPTPVSADEVLSFMAQSAAVVAPSSSVDTSKYVDSESEVRIASFMASFEDIVATNLAAISAEFPNMSDSAKQTLALAQVKS